MLEWIIIIGFIAFVVGAIGALLNWQVLSLGRHWRDELAQETGACEEQPQSPDSSEPETLKQPAEKSAHQLQLEKHNGYGSFVFLGGILTLFIGASSAAGNPQLGGKIAIAGLALAFGGYIFMRMTKKQLDRVKESATDNSTFEGQKEESRSS